MKLTPEQIQAAAQVLKTEEIEDARGNLRPETLGQLYAAITASATCKTCVHWKDGDRCGDDIIEPTDPDTWEPMVMPFKVKLCENPALLFCERPLESNGFAVADGSTYMAMLYTAEDFGCVRHEPNPLDELTRLSQEARMDL